MSESPTPSLPEREVLTPSSLNRLVRDLLEDALPLLPFLMLCDFEFQPFRLRYRLSGTRVDEVTGILDDVVGAGPVDIVPALVDPVPTYAMAFTFGITIGPLAARL